jgi:hypothetical protein
MNRGLPQKDLRFLRYLLFKTAFARLRRFAAKIRVYPENRRSMFEPENRNKNRGFHGFHGC